MIIVNRGKELTLRRLCWDHSFSGTVEFSGINAMIFGVAYNPNFSSGTIALNSGVLQVPVVASIVQSPALGIKFTASIYEQNITGNYTLNEVGLAFVSGLGNQIIETSNTNYTLFSYSPMHELLISGGGAASFNVSITIYYT